MTSRAFRLLMLVLAFALVATACSDGESGDTTTTAAPADTTTTAAPSGDTTTTVADATGVSCEEPVKVGVITDMTGALAIFGTHIVRAFPIGMEYATGSTAEGDIASGQTYTIDDCDIEVIWKDDTSDAEASVAAARELIEVDGVDIIVGSVHSGVTAGIQELAKDNDVIHIAAPAAANDLTGVNFNENSFRVSRNNYQDAVAACEYLTTKYTTFVNVAPDYAFGHGGASAYKDACSVLGGEFPVDNILVPAGTTDFTPYAEEILASGAEVWTLTWAGGDLPQLFQAAADTGVNDEMELGASFFDNVLLPLWFQTQIGSTAPTLYHYTQPDNAINDYLIAATQALETPTFPDLFDADGMNAAIAIIEALKITGGDASADALRDALEGIVFEGPKGTIEIRAEDHVALQDMYIVTLTNLDDPEFKFFETVSTVRPEVPCLLEGEYVDRCGDLPVGSLGG
ncbi:MAG: substrate-binding domain-containing protein [Actinomycetota bacterium]